MLTNCLIMLIIPVQRTRHPQKRGGNQRTPICHHQLIGGDQALSPHKNPARNPAAFDRLDKEFRTTRLAKGSSPGAGI